jgi:acetate kinase
MRKLQMSSMRILVVNSGSSSLKLRVIDDADAVVARADLPAIDPAAAGSSALDAAIASFGNIDAVGHRVVHGGTEFVEPVVVDAGVFGRIDALTPLAPLHQPGCMAGIRWVATLLRSVPQVACFDTAFHAGIPAAAATYALPAAWRDRWGLRRFGFHGLSHAWAARRAAELLDMPTGELRTVTCHLGAGASLAAIAGGRSVDTTMGFTPLEGLVMATRSGSVDPGLVLWLQQQGGLDAEAVADGLEHESGLAGLAGPADMREVLAAAERGDARGVLARDVYLHRLRAGIAAMTASLGGLDALVFTGGVGERAPVIRAGAVAGLGFLGLAIDARRNEGAVPDTRIDAGTGPGVLVVESREDLEMVRQVRLALA